MIELSNAAYDKLYAAACHDLGDTAGFGADYLEACARWYADLTPQERTSATAAVAAFDLGRESDGRQLLGCCHPRRSSSSDGPHRLPFRTARDGNSVRIRTEFVIGDSLACA